MVIDTRTSMPIARWAEIMGINPLHFQGVVAESVKPITVCEQPWFQYEWQEADRVSREAVARAIADAEEQLEGVLGFSLLPRWYSNERHPAPVPARPDVFNVAQQGVRGFSQAIRLKRGYVQTFGQRTKAVIQAGRPIVWSDPDNDNYKEIGTVTATTTVTDVNEIALYYPSQNGADRYEIRPLRSVAISGGTVTITFRRELAVLEELQVGMDATQVDGMDDDNFLGTVDVYRVYTDPTTQVQFLWEPLVYCCSDGSCVQCQFVAQTGCMTIRDKRAGMVAYRPATYDSDTGEWTSTSWSDWRTPDQLRCWYKAGWRDENAERPDHQMDSKWERAVAYYAASLLDRGVCECNNLHAWIERWRTDLAANQPDGVTYQNDADLLRNPLGTMAGAVHAWRTIRNSGETIGYAARV